MTDIIKTVDQRRAKLAWDLVSNVADKNRKEYTTLVRNAGALILTNGLLQTLAFWRAKEKPHIIEHINELLKQELGLEEFDLFTKLRDNETNAVTYSELKNLTLAVIIWLKRFAEAKS